MKKSVYDYFNKLENLGLQMKNNSFLSTDPNIIKFNHLNNRFHNVDYYKVGKTFGFTKYWDGVNSVFDMASSKMYGDIGILTPPIYLLTNPDKKGLTHHYGEYFTLTEDIHILPKFRYASLLHDIPEFKKVSSTAYPRSDKWSILLDPLLRSRLLEFMTETCLEELISIYLADTLRSETDRHTKNLFLYKTTPKGKYDGVIAIDNAMGAICSHSDHTFNSFLFEPYVTMTVFDGMDRGSHGARLKDIRSFISDGDLTTSQIIILKNLLSYNFPKEVRNVCRKYKLNDKDYKDNLYDSVSKLWEFNHDNIGRELGL